MASLPTASPLLALPGAVGDTVAHHYGNPATEQRLLATGDAVVDCSDWGVVRVSGPDRLVWLNSISSQQLLGLQPGESTESLILDPNGHVEHRFMITDDGESSWLATEPDTTGALVAWLERMRFRMEVTIDDLTADYAVLASCGGGPDTLTADVIWRDHWPHVAVGGVGYGPTPHPGEGLDGVYWLCPRTELRGDRYGSWAGQDALDALQIRAGRPQLTAEVDPKTLPHELDWLRTAVALDKGCYRGQETVAKVHNLGHPPRRLVILHLDGSGVDLPEAGASVMAGDVEVGRVTRVARHYEWGPIGLAVIKRTIDPDAPLSVVVEDGVVAANQEILVGQDAGATRREAIRQKRSGLA